MPVAHEQVPAPRQPVGVARARVDMQVCIHDLTTEPPDNVNGLRVEGLTGTKYVLTVRLLMPVALRQAVTTLTESQSETACIY